MEVQGGCSLLDKSLSLFSSHVPSDCEYYFTYLWGEWHLFLLFLFALVPSRCFVPTHHQALTSAAIFVHTEHGVRVPAPGEPLLLVLYTLLLELLLIIHLLQHLLLLELLLGECLNILVGEGHLRLTGVGGTLGCKAGEVHLVLTSHWLLQELLRLWLLLLVKVYLLLIYPFHYKRFNKLLSQLLAMTLN